MKHKKSMGGFTLVENLVATLVLSTGLLGLGLLQAKGMKYHHSAEMRSQASIEAANILDRMRANRAEVIAGAYNIGFAATPSGSGTAVTDMIAWKAKLVNNFPEGDGSIACTDTLCTVTIQWLDVLPNGDRGMMQFPLTSQL